MQWLPISTAPQGVKVLTAIIDENGERNIQAMTLHNNLWFVGEMYVYYTPTHWKIL